MPRFELLLIALLLFATNGLNAQTPEAVVRIQVVHDGQAIAGADVLFGRLRAVSDSSGFVSMRATAGSKALRVQRIGYAAHQSVVRLGVRDTAIVVSLEAEAEAIEEIVVLSTRTGKRIEDEPLRVEVLGAEEIEEKTMMTPGDVAMMLNETSGLRVQITSPSLAAANVRVQGLRGRYTQLLSDGLPLYGGQSGALGLLQIPPVDLGQVEVIKGAASALYGASALGGVINLISRRPDGSREVLLNQTTLDGSDAVLWMSGAIDSQWRYSFTGGAHRQARADIDEDGWSDVPEYRRLVLRPRLFWTSERGHSAFITLGATVEERAGGTEGGSTGLDVREALDTRRGDVGASAWFAVGGNRFVNIRTSGMIQSHDHTYDTARERDRHSTAFAEATWRGESGAHTWLLGAAFQHDGYESDDVAGFDYSFNVPSLFAQDEVALGALTMSASARLDQHSEYGTFVAPRLSALHRPTENWSLRASVGSGYFAPTPFTEETEAVGLGNVSPIAGIDAETAITASVDLNHVRGPFEFNVTAFGSQLEHAIRLDVNPGGTMSLVNARGVTRARGTELLVRYHVEGIHVTATHTFIVTSEPTERDTARQTVPLTPRHALGLVAMREYEGKGRLAIELYFTGEQQLEDNPYRKTSKPYLVFGMLAERRFGPARVFLNAENLLDARQTRHDPLLRPARSSEGRWTVDAWAPLEGRVFNLGARIGW